jgi:bifunctional non-homologous end joining protein LigD
VIYPKLNVTKKQVIEYYIKIAPRILSFLNGRALTLTRFPDGIDTEGFFEKDAPKGRPNWIKTFKRQSRTLARVINHIVCDDIDTLLWLANIVALELHIPLSTIYDVEKPDILLFDLDPEPPAGIREAAIVSELLKEKLDSLGLKGYIKTSGKKGLHILTPIIPKYTFKQTREFVHTIGIFLAKESDLAVSERSQTEDPGTVLIDYTQNSLSRTIISPYSLRSQIGAPVSTPLEWRELKGDISDMNIFNVVLRKKDPWSGFWEDKHKLEVN